VGGREQAVVKDRPAGDSADERPAAGQSSDLLWRLFRVLLVAAVYYVAARLSLRLALVGRNVTPLWPPTGLAVAAFVVLGRRVWPGVAVAAFLVNEPISTSPLAAAATAAGNTLAPMVAAWLLQRVGFRREIDRLRDALAIVFLGALGSMLISASIGTATLVVSGAIPGREFLQSWAVWWTGDAMGVLVVAPFLLSLLLFRPTPRLSVERYAEAAGLVLLLTVVAVAVVRTDMNFMFLIVPLLGWTAWRFQQRGAAPAALIVAGIATWAAAHGWGPFHSGSLFEKMAVLQAFNATVAFTSFVFAALVTERLRAREALERAAAELEERVRRRTAELVATNERLTHEIAEREEAERALRDRERQLADAQRVARIGSWEWDVGIDRVTWSDEMYRIHGYDPQAFPVTFEKAVEHVHASDLSRIRASLAKVLERRTDQELPGSEYRIVRPDGVERVLLGRSRLSVDPSGSPVRLVGTVQDITEDKQAEREHRIAETLQRSLLPERLPEIPGVLLAARYMPATGDVEIGGDWYDVVQLASGRVGVAIGDVAGHGLRAASSMGQLRMALRAYAIRDEAPAEVLTKLHQLVRGLMPKEMATLVYLVLDVEAGMVTFANAGHPPPLLIRGIGDAAYLEGGLAPPLGTASNPYSYHEAMSELPWSSTLLLFTDGLVERRGASIEDGLAQLRESAAGADPDLDALCDRLLASMVGEEASDDVALLALRPVPLAGRALHLRVPAEPSVLAPLRHTLRRWLREVGASVEESYEILVSCGEACTNAIQHPYGARDGTVEVGIELVDGAVEVVVRDEGRWRPPSTGVGGRGLELMRGLMDSVEVASGVDGTVVRMRRRLDARVPAHRAERP
jgi:PAS domain S-box-containing protein